MTGRQRSIQQQGLDVPASDRHEDFPAQFRFLVFFPTGEAMSSLLLDVRSDVNRRLRRVEHHLDYVVARRKVWARIVDGYHVSPGRAGRGDVDHHVAVDGVRHFMRKNVGKADARGRFKMRKG